MNRKTSTIIAGMSSVVLAMICSVHAEINRSAAVVAGPPGQRPIPQRVLQSAIKAAGAESKVLILAEGNWSITDDLTVPANVTLKFSDNASLVVSQDKILTIEGRLIANPARIFHGQGKVKYGGVAHPPWWGAVGDGKTDDSEAIQAAMDAVAGDHPYGYGSGVVHLSAGIYRTSSTLILQNGVTFRGDSQASSILFYDGPEQAIVVAGLAATVKDLHVTGLSPFTEAWNRSIRVGFGRAEAGILIRSVDTKIQNCTITYFNRTDRKAVGIKTDGGMCFSGLIRDSYIRYCWGGVSIEDVATDWSVIDTTILDVTKFGISLGYDWTTGKQTEFTGDNFRFVRCVIENINNGMNEPDSLGDGYAIFLARGAVINIRGVYIEDWSCEEGHRAYGIYANGMADARLLQINIHGCNIASGHLPNSESIHLENHWYGTVGGNHLSGGSDQIRQMPSSRWVQIAQNFFTGNPQDSISLGGGASLACELSHGRIRSTPDIKGTIVLGE